MILLALEGSGEVVQFGIMRVDLRYCDETVRAEILCGKTPLGRILIEHDVLRHINPTAYLRITPNREFMECFGLKAAEPAYGRLATIFCNGLPAVDLLEIVRPENPAGRPGHPPN
jgi:chorismate-pyruvate lyase